MATYVGLLEADLQGAVEYKSGGIGPLFQELRAEEPLPLDQMLSRMLVGLRKAGLRTAVSLFVDDAEVYSDPEAGAEDNIDALQNNAREADVGAGTSFYLMLVHQDAELSHLITVEASADHPADEAAISLLDLARFTDGYEEEQVEEEEAEEDEGGADIAGDQGADITVQDQGLPDITYDERDGEALVEAFLQKLLAALQKELPLDEPELETWTDWEGEYDPDRFASSAIPGGLG